MLGNHWFVADICAIPDGLSEVLRDFCAIDQCSQYFALALDPIFWFTLRAKTRFVRVDFNRVSRCGSSSVEDGTPLRTLFRWAQSLAELGRDSPAAKKNTKHRCAIVVGFGRN